MKNWLKLKPGLGPALLAALLFGASTPLAKLLVNDVSRGSAEIRAKMPHKLE